MPTIHFVYKKIETKLKTSPSKLRNVTAPVKQQLEHIKSKFIKMTKTSQEAHSSRESHSQFCPKTIIQYNYYKHWSLMDIFVLI